MSVEMPSNDSSAQPSPANPPPWKPSSERKIQANRQNALRSTGPKTERGKRTVARNAIKHGLLAREQLHEQYEPVGIVEESLVQTIATCWWRKARVIRAENGEIRKRLDTPEMDRTLRNSDEANLAVTFLEMDLFLVKNQADRHVSTRDRWSAFQVAQSSLERHEVGLVYLTALLEEAKSEITCHGCMSESTGKKLMSTFGLRDCLLTLTCLCAQPPAATVEDGPSQNDEERKAATERVGAAIAMIDHRLEIINLLRQYAKERENLAVDAERRSFSLPPAEATDKLLRYESHLDRQLYRAMDQLERLQRQHRGEIVPPPLNVNLGRAR
jgi:hypothetical protein